MNYNYQDYREFANIEDEEKMPPIEPEPKKPPRRISQGFDGDPTFLGRLDLRVGKVIHVEDHITDDNIFYFERIESHARVSKVFVYGLNKFYNTEDFENKHVVLLYVAMPFWWNTQESRLLGVLAARSPNKAELLIPPAGSEVGARISVKGLINSGPRPTKRSFQFCLEEQTLLSQVAAYLKINSKKIATYKGVPLEVRGKGFVTSETLINCPVR